MRSETNKTLAGEDVIAVIEGTSGPIVDGRPYHEEGFRHEVERYHELAAEAHTGHGVVEAPLPELNGGRRPDRELLGSGCSSNVRRATPRPEQVLSGRDDET